MHVKLISISTREIQIDTVKFLLHSIYYYQISVTTTIVPTLGFIKGSSRHSYTYINPLFVSLGSKWSSLSMILVTVVYNHVLMVKINAFAYVQRPDFDKI